MIGSFVLRIMRRVPRCLAVAACAAAIGFSTASPQAAEPVVSPPDAREVAGHMLDTNKVLRNLNATFDWMMWMNDRSDAPQPTNEGLVLTNRTFTGIVNAEGKFRVTGHIPATDSGTGIKWQEPMLYVCDGRDVLMFYQPDGAAVTAKAGSPKSPISAYSQIQFIIHWTKATNGIMSTSNVSVVGAHGVGPDRVITLRQPPGSYSTFEVTHDVLPEKGHTAIRSTYRDTRTDAIARVVEASGVEEIAKDVWRPRSFTDTRYKVVVADGAYQQVKDEKGERVIDYRLKLEVSNIHDVNQEVAESTFFPVPPPKARSLTRFERDGSAKQVSNPRVGLNGSDSVREALKVQPVRTELATLNNPARAIAMWVSLASTALLLIGLGVFLARKRRQV